MFVIGALWPNRKHSQRTCRVNEFFCLWADLTVRNSYGKSTMKFLPERFIRNLLQQLSDWWIFITSLLLNRLLIGLWSTEVTPSNTFANLYAYFSLCLRQLLSYYYRTATCDIIKKAINSTKNVRKLNSLIFLIQLNFHQN